jgi:hypothetical protein
MDDMDMHAYHMRMRVHAAPCMHEGVGNREGEIDIGER